MVYDSVIISLQGENGALPTKFVELKKRSDELILKFYQKEKSDGILFVYANKKFMLMRIATCLCEFRLENSFEDDFVFCYKTGSQTFSGMKGEVSGEKEIMQTFEEKYRKLQTENKDDDLNALTDNIMQTLFLRQENSFFEHTKKELFGLFSSCKRADELEKIIPFSRFVELQDDGAFAGIVYRNKVPFAIGVGFKDANSLVNHGLYQYFFSKNAGDNGYFLSFRRATDGDRVEIK